VKSLDPRHGALGASIVLGGLTVTPIWREPQALTCVIKGHLEAFEELGADRCALGGLSACPAAGNALARKSKGAEMTIEG
jgi:hypothetical protein